MRTLRDWAEEHWAGVGTVVSISGALAIAVILAVGFNVVTTRLDGRPRVHPTLPVSNARPVVSSPGS